MASINAKQRLVEARSHRWFHNLTPEQRSEYKKKYPGTKFVEPTKILVESQKR